ncbi:hypothetical protein PTKIN_Ptkin04bG0056200 [Pterospermum kingtungense]
MVGLLLFKRACSLASNKATLTTKATTSAPPFSLVRSLPYKTFSSISKPTTQNQVLIHPFHHHYSLIPWRPSSQPSLAAGKQLLFFPLVAKQFWYFSLLKTHYYFKVYGKSFLDNYCRAWTFLCAQVNPKPGAKLGSFEYLPWKQWRSMFQRFKSSDMIKSLVIINVAVFVMWWIADNNFMANNFTISVENFRNGRMHTLITAAFSHSDPGILLWNMIGLATFGPSLERMFGAAYVLKLYLAGAICGSLFHVVQHAFLALSSKEQGERDPSKTPGLGANGAVCAIMMLTIFRFPKATVYINFALPVPAAVVVIKLTSTLTKKY